MAKSENLTVRAMRFLTSKARVAFTQLKQVFTKAIILQHFDPKYYIRIKTNVSNYTISEFLSQLTLDDLSRWHKVVYFLKKMIPAEMRYKTYNDKLLAIIRVFKTWCYYLEGYKYKVLMFTDHNNLC